MYKIFTVFNVLILIVNASSFGGGDDRFIKKYAMMKIYESCFGPDVVKQIRKEMKAACAKCASLEAPTHPAAIRPIPTQPHNPDSTESENSLYPNAPNFDTERLHQAILAYRPASPFQSFYRPFPGISPYYNQPYVNPAYQNQMFYPGFQQSGQFSPYNVPVVGQSFFTNRMSRDLDIKGQLEILTSRMSGKVRNVTCVMQELGYLDDNLEPNYAKISERIGNLPIGEELRKDMQEGVTFCQQFSQCVPEIKRNKSPLSRELIRPMFFFKCYKYKKLEACVMKDVREKFTDVTEEEFDEDVEIRRSKSLNFGKSDMESDDLASSMYEFLYGTDSNMDLDSIL